MTTTKRPRIVLYDIETTHNLVAVFGLLNYNMLPHENILRERYVVSASWKELGEKEVHSVSVLDDPKRYAKDPHDDRFVIEKLHQVLSEADVIVAHNGDEFDLKYVETRILVHGLSPLPPILKIDTLKTARKRFYFNTNKLDYLGQFLGVGRKIKTDNELWLRIAKGDQSAIREMVTYNKQDVKLLERVFLKLRPYIPDHVNRQLFGGSVGCPRCGSNDTQSRGTHKSLTQVYNRFQCNACGGWFRNNKATSRTNTRIL